MALESKPFLEQFAGPWQASRQAASSALVPVAAAPRWLKGMGARVRSGMASMMPEVSARVLRAPDEIELLRVAIAAAHEKNTALEARLTDLSARLKAHVSGLRTSHSMNLTLRGQVLKMSRSGRQPEQIAGALGVPRGEVLLLLHLQLRHLQQWGDRDPENRRPAVQKSAGL